MKVLISGSTGLVGSALIPLLKANGHSIARLTRPSSHSRSKLEDPEVLWDPNREKIDLSGLEGHDAVINLAGENIFGIWTAEKKDRIRKSRVNGTELISRSLAELKNPPKDFICASAIGYYGDRGDEVLTEESSPGKGFLADVCRDWESATEPAIRKGIRVVNTRFGVVLSSDGGALKTMLLPFRMGAGGKIGSGEQYMSWIAIDDAVGAIYHALTNKNLKGALNVVAPNPVTNKEFTKTLGGVLRRPTFLSVPESLLRFVANEMADEVLLISERIMPKKLISAGYEFRYPNLEDALKHLLHQ